MSPGSVVGMYAWGSNLSSQMARDENELISSPLPILILPGVTEAVGGNMFACGRQAGDRLLSCWGYNAEGQVGSGSTAQQVISSPVVISGSDAVLAFDLGPDFACYAPVYNADNLSQTRCWGNNEFGQLGTGDLQSTATPSEVSGSTTTLRHFVQLALGPSHTCAIYSDKNLMCWGSNAFGEVGQDNLAGTFTSPEPVPGPTGSSSSAVYDQITAGSFYTCTRANGSEIWCFGDGSNGALGQGSDTSDSSIPVQVTMPAAVDISGRGRTLYASTTSGDVYAWGSNTSLQIGSSSITADFVYSPVAVIQGQGITRVASTDSWACAMGAFQDTTLACWGNGGYGQLGIGTSDNHPDPVPVPPSEGMTWNFIGLGGQATFGYQDFEAPAAPASPAGDSPESPSGSPDSPPPVPVFQGISTWGQNTSGLLGIGNDQPNYATSPTPMPSGTATAVPAIGGDFSCFLDGTSVSCWGSNSASQLAQAASTIDSNSPLVVSGLTAPSGLTCGYQHSCVLDAGVGKCWGSNGSGQLGIGTTTNSAVPVAIQGAGASYAQLSAGWSHTCGVTTTAVLQCWGDNTNGQLGEGNNYQRQEPVNVPGENWSEACAGYYTSCGLQSGDAYCWGSNNFGQVGNGNTQDQSYPVLVSGMSGLSNLTTWAVTTCALGPQSRVYCWGYGTDGQMGHGAGQATNLYPDGPAGTGAYVSVVSGGTHVCATEAVTYDVYCWGSNLNGLLGIGQDNTYNYNTPQALGIKGFAQAKINNTLARVATLG
ncbi:hypothetical protein H632_c986p0 [Helicosporidium sp. ATCC 50920]|nr:hypothetical protein H632_c986p0 [Helicosporidium sp. ATCC 50920]|eukprot:KDD74921.1 hypothetical protein H632_c986p0 [Helicosporidium sp. ATCC 50920]